MQAVKDLFIIFSVFSQILFFCFCQLLGYNFTGSESSPLFKIFILFIGGLSIILVVWDILLMKVQQGSTYDHSIGVNIFRLPLRAQSQPPLTAASTGINQEHQNAKRKVDLEWFISIKCSSKN